MQILIQPQQKGYRFRYLCEGQAHGPILGEGSSKENKVFPTVELHNCPPHANVCLHLSLCAEDSDQVHMHNLHGKNVFNGEYFEQLQTSGIGYLRHSLQGISILQTKNDIRNEILGCKIAQKSILQQKGILEYIHLMKEWSKHNVEFDTSCFKSKIHNLESYIAQAVGIYVANNAVRLHYQAFVFNNDSQFVHLQLFTQPVFDNKAPSRAILKIHRISRVVGNSIGGEEVFLLCDKIEKGDIEVIFYTKNPEGGKHIFGYGQFSPVDVWHQYAIVFKTPPCCSYERVEANICLRRKKNPNDMSNSFTFTFNSQLPFPPYFPQEPLMDTSTVINMEPYPDLSQIHLSYQESHPAILPESFSLNTHSDYSFNSTLSHYQQTSFEQPFQDLSLLDPPPPNQISRQHSPSLFQQPSPQNRYQNIRGSDYGKLS